MLSEHSPRGETIETLHAQHEAKYHEMLPALVAMAKQARDESAYNHRNFLVGCALLAWHPEKGYDVFVAGNFKGNHDQSHDGGKKCAERLALNAVHEAGYTKVVAFVTASNGLLPGEHHVESKTLLPCAPCMEMMHSSPLVSEATHVTTVNDFATVTTRDGKFSQELNQPEIIEERLVSDLIK